MCFQARLSVESVSRWKSFCYAFMFCRMPLKTTTTTTKKRYKKRTFDAYRSRLIVNACSLSIQESSNSWSALSRLQSVCAYGKRQVLFFLNKHTRVSWLCKLQLQQMWDIEWDYKLFNIVACEFEQKIKHVKVSLCELLGCLNSRLKTSLSVWLYAVLRSLDYPQKKKEKKD